MRKRRRLGLALIVIGLVALVGLYYAATSTPRVSLAVSFLGVTNDAAGAPMSIFNVTNQGAATIVLWGAYHIDAKQWGAVRHPTVFTWDYVYLSPGQSHTALVYPPETKGPWKVSVWYSRYTAFCKWGIFTLRLPENIRDRIPERFRIVPKSLVASDWVAP